MVVRKDRGRRRRKTEGNRTCTLIQDFKESVVNKLLEDGIFLKKYLYIRAL